MYKAEFIPAKVVVTEPAKVVVSMSAEDAGNIRALLGGCRGVSLEVYHSLTNLAIEGHIPNRFINLRVDCSTSKSPEIEDFKK